MYEMSKEMYDDNIQKKSRQRKQKVPQFERCPELIQDLEHRLTMIKGRKSREWEEGEGGRDVDRVRGQMVRNGESLQIK